MTRRIRIILIPAAIVVLLSLLAEDGFQRNLDENKVVPDRVGFTVHESFQGNSDENEQTSTEDDQPQLNVLLKVFRIGLLRYHVIVKVKNEGEKLLVLQTTRPAGGYVVTNEHNETIYSEPKYVTFCIYDLQLWPGQSKIIYDDTLRVKVRWLIQEKELRIQGFLFSYLYNGNSYPQIKSEPFPIKTRFVKLTLNRLHST